MNRRKFQKAKKLRRNKACLIQTDVETAILINNRTLLESYLMLLNVVSFAPYLSRIERSKAIKRIENCLLLL
jgi:hypothetical protein